MMIRLLKDMLLPKQKTLIIVFTVRGFAHLTLVADPYSGGLWRLPFAQLFVFH